MSRIGREPITIPAGVTFSEKDGVVTVKGPKGTLTKNFNAALTYELDGNVLHVKRPNDEREMKMLHGTTRALIHDMIVGVSEGFKKTLQIQGVGYRAEMKGESLVLHIGHSHEDVVNPLPGVKITFDGKNMEVNVEGIDKQLVGQQAAVIRAVKKPECYHGKGVRYKGEVVVLRQAASAKKSTK